MRTVNTSRALSLLGIIVVVSAVAWGLHQLQAHRNVKIFFEEAQRAAEEEDYPRALRSYRSVLNLQPRDITTREAYADLLFELGDYTGAGAEYEYLLRLDSSMSHAKYRAAECAAKIGRFGDATTHLDQLLASDNSEQAINTPEAFHLLAASQSARGELNEAINSFEKAVQREDALPESYVGLADLLERSGADQSEQDEPLRLMVERNPESAEAFRLQTQFLFRRAIRLASEDRQGLSTAALNMAKASARRSNELDPEDHETVFLLAQIARFEGEQETSLALAKKSIELQPDFPLGYSLVADVQASQGELSAAIATLEQALQACSDSASESILTSLASYYIDADRTEDAQSALVRLRKLNASSPLVAYLQGRLEYDSEQWLSAIGHLEKARAGISSPLITRAVEMFIGLCRRNLGDLNLAEQALKRSVELDEQWLPSRRALTTLQFSLGDFEDALLNAKVLLRVGNRNPADLLLACEIALNNPGEDEFATSCLQELAGADLPPIQIARLQAVASYKKSGVDASISILQQALQKVDSSADQEVVNQCRLTLTRLLLERGDTSEAEQVMAQAEQQSPSAAVRIAAMEFKLRSLDKDQIETKLREALRENSSEDPDFNKVKLGIADVALRYDLVPLAAEVYESLTAEVDGDLAAIRLGLAVASRQNSVESLDEVLDRIERHQGRGSLWHYAKAIREIESAGGDDYETSLTHVEQALEFEPGSPLLLRLRGDILLRQGERQAALENYRTAFENGERDIPTLGRLLGLLIASNQDSEAQRVADFLSTRVSGLDRELVALVARFYLRTREAEKAFRMTEQFARIKPSAESLSLLAATAQTILAMPSISVPLDESQLVEQAEQALQEALSAKPESETLQLQWIRFLADQDRKTEAVAHIEKVQDSLLAKNQHLVVASMLKSVGETQRQQSVLSKFVETNNGAFEAVRALVASLMEAQEYESAEMQLVAWMQRGVSETDQAVWGSRTLATIYMLSNQTDKADEIERLLAKNLAIRPDSVADLRILALAQEARGSSQHRENAVKTWERILRLGTDLSHQDEFRIANLYRSQSRFDESASHLKTAIATCQDPGAKNSYIRSLIRIMIENDQLAECERWIRALGSTRPAEASLLRSEIALRSGAIDEAKQELSTAIDQAQADADRLEVAALARQIFNVSLFADSETREVFLLQALKILESVTASPATDLLIAEAKGRLGRGREALAMIQEISIESPDLTTALTAIELSVRQSPGDQGVRELALKLSDNLLQEFGQLPRILGCRAAIQSIDGKSSEAEQSYRKILETDPGNIIALNNLAILLLDDEARLKEAAELSERAIGIAGRRAPLLDTRAMAALAEGNAGLAVKLLDEAISKGNEPAYWFHRSVANSMLGKEEEAADDFNLAQSKGLDVGNLDQLDKAWLQDLPVSVAPGISGR